MKIIDIVNLDGTPVLETELTSLKGKTVEFTKILTIGNKMSLKMIKEKNGYRARGTWNGPEVTDIQYRNRKLYVTINKEHIYIFQI